MRFLLLFCCIAVLSGCSMMGGPVATTPITTYTITRWPETVEKPVQSTSKSTLLVTTPIAAPGYETSAMLYMKIPYQLKTYAENRWVSPPADLLLPLLANRIRLMHIYRAVVTPPFSGQATYQLNTQLLALQQEFMQPVSQVRLRVSATLIQIATGEVVASRVFESVQPAADNNPYSGVLATNKAANQIA